MCRAAHLCKRGRRAPIGQKEDETDELRSTR